MSNIIPQSDGKAQGLSGPVYITEAGEWAVYLDGECVGWASTELAAEKMYTEALVSRRVHFQRNPANQEAANV